MQLLKQSTAATIKLGPFLDEDDGKTQETALTIAQASIRLSKNGGAFAQSNNAAGATHDEKAWYGVPLDTTDTGTLGRLKVAVHVSGALPCWEEYLVVPAAVHDAYVSGSGNGIRGDVQAVAAGAITATAIAADAITAAKIADGAIDRTTFAADTGLQTSRSNTAQAGAAGTITLDASASAVTDFYKDALLTITGGTGVGQTRLISSYNGTTKVATITPNWATNPDNTSTFAVLPRNRVSLGAIADGLITAEAIADNAIDRATFAADTSLQTIRSNTAQAGAAGTITLDASASAVDDFYNGAWVYLTGGTGAGQVRLISDYNGTTKVATIVPNWATTPDNTSTFAVLPVNRVTIDGDAAAAALLDLTDGVETGMTLRNTQRVLLAAMAGVLSGAGTTSVEILDTTGLITRITATVDSSGNRSVIVFDLSD